MLGWARVPAKAVVVVFLLLMSVLTLVEELINFLVLLTWIRVSSFCSLGDLSILGDLLQLLVLDVHLMSDFAIRDSS